MRQAGLVEAGGTGIIIFFWDAGFGDFLSVEIGEGCDLPGVVGGKEELLVAGVDVKQFFKTKCGQLLDGKTRQTTALSIRGSPPTLRSKVPYFCRFINRPCC